MIRSEQDSRQLYKKLIIIPSIIGNIFPSMIGKQGYFTGQIFELFRSGP